MDTTARTPPFGIATAVALLLGITACLCLPALLSWPLWPLFAAPLALGAWLWTRRDWKRIAGACLLGFGLCGLHVAHALSQQLPLELERQRSEEHTSELQSLMRISYAVFCLKKKKNKR